MPEWKLMNVGDIAEIFDGPHATPTKTGVGPWFLSISSLKQGQLDLSESAHLSEEDFQKWTRRVTPREGDVLFSYETRLGEAALMPSGIQACLGRRMGLLRAKEGRADARFLLYAYLGPEFQQVIRERSIHGATVDRIPLVDLSEWPIRLPSLAEQKAVSALLGTLDDKIAVNDRIVSSVDALSEAVLEDLLLDSEITDCRLGDLAAVNLRKVSPASGGSLRYIDISSVSVGTIEWPGISSWDDAPGRARRGISAGDVIWSTVRPNRKSFALILDDDPLLVASTGFAVLTPQKVGPSFLYEVVKRDEFVQYLESVAEGSAYPAVRADRFGQAHIPLPASDRVEKFESTAMPLRRRAHAAEVESRTLEALRNELLPKLMSGQIRVRDAERVVEDVT